MTAFVTFVFILGIATLLLPSWPSCNFRRFKVGGERGLSGLQSGYKDHVDFVLILPPYKLKIYDVTPSRF